MNKKPIRRKTENLPTEQEMFDAFEYAYAIQVTLFGSSNTTGKSNKFLLSIQPYEDEFAGCVNKWGVKCHPITHQKSGKHTLKSHDAVFYSNVEPMIDGVNKAKDSRFWGRMNYDGHRQRLNNTFCYCNPNSANGAAVTIVMGYGFIINFDVALNEFIQNPQIKDKDSDTPYMLFSKTIKLQDESDQEST